MHIQPTNNLSNVSQSQVSATQVKSERHEGVKTPVDQLDLSFEAQMMMNRVDSGFRADRVADLRSQIASGRYETREKIEMALDRILDEIA
jgi:negative regulator of flagellin synthesis FlgM